MQYFDGKGSECSGAVAAINCHVAAAVVARPHAHALSQGSLDHATMLRGVVDDLSLVKLQACEGPTWAVLEHTAAACKAAGLPTWPWGAHTAHAQLQQLQEHMKQALDVFIQEEGTLRRQRNAAGPMEAWRAFAEDVLADMDAGSDSDVDSTNSSEAAQEHSSLQGSGMQAAGVCPAVSAGTKSSDGAAHVETAVANGDSRASADGSAGGSSSGDKENVCDQLAGMALEAQAPHSAGAEAASVDDCPEQVVDAGTSPCAHHVTAAAHEQQASDCDLQDGAQRAEASLRGVPQAHAAPAGAWWMPDAL